MQLCNPQCVTSTEHFRVNVSLMNQMRALKEIMGFSVKHICIFTGGFGNASRWLPVAWIDINPSMGLVGGIFSISRARCLRQCLEVEKL